MKRVSIIIGMVILTTSAWAQSVFDMPRLFPQHRFYLSQFITSAQKQNWMDAEVAARSAVKLFPRDANWNYNVACICAKDKRAGEALEWLEKAILLGFTNTKQILADDDLKTLHTSPKFNELIEKAKTLASHPPKNPTLTSAFPSQITFGQTAEVTAENTQWDWNPTSGGYMTTLFQPFKPKGDLPPYTGPYAEKIQAWIEEGTAAGNVGDFYVNRDEDRTPIRYDAYPLLTPVLYSEEAVKAYAHMGPANGCFATGLKFLPTIGNSVLPMQEGTPTWRSIPRHCTVDAMQSAVAMRLAHSNQFYLYDATVDYNKHFKGDLLVTNTTMFLMTTDLTSERANPVLAQTQMTELVLAALASMHPETKEEMLRKGLLVPTVQRLIRQHVKGADYFSAMAHPIAFDPQHIDGEALIESAHALRSKDLPPMLQLRTRQDQMPKQGVDYFDLFPSEGIVDTPFGITRVHRGKDKTRSLTVEASAFEPGITFRWFLVNGDADKVRIRPLTSSGSLVTLEVDHHAPFERDGMVSRRVDIACIGLRADGTASAPCFVSIRSLNNERRTYSSEGKILTIDYTTPETGYAYEDPLLSAFKNWTDTYHYDANGKMTGWTRTRPNEDEPQHFDARGRRIVARAPDGTPTKLVNVSYMPRTLKGNNGITAPFIELIQNDVGEPFTATP